MTAIFLSAATETRMTSKVVLASAAGAAAAGWSRTGGGDGRGGADAPLGFQFLHQVGDFHHRRIAEFFYDFCFI